MKPYFQSCITFLLMIVGVVSLEAGTLPEPSGWHRDPSYTLYPVTGFTVSWVETIRYLSWQQPELPGGGIPPGLIGYQVYRNNQYLWFVSGQDTTWSYDFQNVEPGEYIYSVTAYYDLTPYGLPGQFGESEPVSDTIYIDCVCCLPFSEPWDQASFAYNNWEFEPLQGNWSITTAEGNPMPASSFTGNPQLLDYSYRMESRFLCPGIFFCASLFLDFDYKLEDLTAGSTETMVVEIYYDSIWHPFVELTNQGSTGWIHQSVDVTQVLPHPCRIGFRVAGENSSNITAWLIDNILFYAVCHPPQNTSLTFSGGNIVTLNWEPPCEPAPTDSSSFTYCIMRSDSSGLPPYEDISGEITDTFYHDFLEPDQLAGHFNYYITTWHYYLGYYYICSANGDTVEYIPTQGVPIKLLPGPVIYPNPATDLVTIESLDPVDELGILDCLGNSILNCMAWDGARKVLDVSSWPAGIYFVKISTHKGLVIRKLTVMH